jgi:hypothetical protein
MANQKNDKKQINYKKKTVVLEGFISSYSDPISKKRWSFIFKNQKIQVNFKNP